MLAENPPLLARLVRRSAGKAHSYFHPAALRLVCQWDKRLCRRRQNYIILLLCSTRNYFRSNKLYNKKFDPIYSNVGISQITESMLTLQQQPKSLFALLSNMLRTAPIYALLSIRLIEASVSCSGPNDALVNVIFISAAQQEAMFIDQDGTWQDLASIACLQLPAYACGTCNDIAVDHIEVSSGHGPCLFTGSDGSSVRVQGGEVMGVGPPQTMSSVVCGVGV